MDARQLKLDCDEPVPGEWRVYCRTTGKVFAVREKSAEFAWAAAADALAAVISDIRRTVHNCEG